MVEPLTDLRALPRIEGEKPKSRPKENKPVKKRPERGFQRKPYTSQAKFDKPKSDLKATSGTSIKTHRAT